MVQASEYKRKRFCDYLVMYSKVTGSSTVSLCDWHSTRACLINTRASAVRPEKNNQLGESGDEKEGKIEG